MDGDIIKEIKIGILGCTHIELRNGITLHKQTRNNGRQKIYEVYRVLWRFWDEC